MGQPVSLPATALATPATPGPTSPPEKKNLGGAPKKNKNARRHGLVCGAAPPDCAGNIAKQVGRFRRDLEHDALVAHGYPPDASPDLLSVAATGAINRAARAEASALMAASWLRKTKDLTSVDRLRFLTTIQRVTEDRDRAVQSLGLSPTPTGAGPGGHSIPAGPCGGDDGLNVWEASDEPDDDPDAPDDPAPVDPPAELPEAAVDEPLAGDEYEFMPGQEGELHDEPGGSGDGSGSGEVGA